MIKFTIPAKGPVHATPTFHYIVYWSLKMTKVDWMCDSVERQLKIRKRKKFTLLKNWISNGIWQKWNGAKGNEDT